MPVMMECAGAGTPLSAAGVGVVAGRGHRVLGVDGDAAAPPPQGGWSARRCRRDTVHRPRPGHRPGRRARLRTEPVARRRPARRGDPRLWDERPAAAAPACFPAPVGRAGMVRDGVREVAQGDQGGQRTIRGCPASSPVLLPPVGGRPRHAGDP